MSPIRPVYFAVILLCFFTSLTGAMKCIFQEHNNNDLIGAIETRLASCPPILLNQEREFCCVDTEFKSYCCSLPEFVLNMSLWLIPVIIILLILSSVVSCICCLCCPCCFVYKRRHGRVYRRTEITATSTSPPYQPVEQQFIAQPSAPPSSAAPKAHLPPGAYPVFPQFTGSGYNTKTN